MCLFLRLLMNVNKMTSIKDALIYTPTSNVWGHSLQKQRTGTSLVAQWLGICLPMQGTRVQALVWEDPTCRRATNPMRHNYWACALQPASHNYWARMPQLLKPVRLEPVLRNEKPLQWEAPRTAKKSSPRSPQLEKVHAQQRRPNAAKNK